MHERPGLEQEGGFVLLSVLVAVSILFLLGMAALDRSLSGLKIARKTVESEQAFYLANAGLEEALSIVATPSPALTGATAITSSTVLQRTVQVAAGVQGTYRVTFSVNSSGLVTATSAGTVGSSSRTLKGTLQNQMPLPPQYLYVAISNGSLQLDNHTNICGDLLANGDILLAAHTTAWNVTTSQDPTSPCSTLQGTGKVVSTNGKVTFQGGAAAMGGWCDSTHYGTGYPCSSQPQPVAFYWPDFSASGLITLGTHWYLQNCTGYPTGSCTTVAPGFTLTLTDPGPYDNDLIYVDGNIQVPTSGFVVQGTVTFVATGTVRYSGNVSNSTSCTSASPCTAAFISQGSQYVDKSKDVLGVFITPASAGFSWDDGAVVRGIINGNVVSSGHQATFYPINYAELKLGKGVPGFTSGSTTFLGWTN